MRLPHDGREYARFTFTGLPADAAVEAKFGDGEWAALEGTGDTRQILICGPDADIGEAVVVPATCVVTVRVTDNPEIVIRQGGTVAIT